MIPTLSKSTDSCPSRVKSVRSVEVFDVAKGDMILAGSKMRFESKNV